MTDEKKDIEMYRCEDCGYTGTIDDFDFAEYTLAYYVGDHIEEHKYHTETGMGYAVLTVRSVIKQKSKEN